MLSTMRLAEDEQLCELLLYFGGPVNYDRYVDPQAADELVDLGLIRRNSYAEVELTQLGQKVCRAMAAGGRRGVRR